MFCPNCGVELENVNLNNLTKCDVCSVDLQLLQKFNLVRETPPKNNYSRLSSFARSLKSRSMDIDKFIEEQREYLEKNGVTLKRSVDYGETKAVQAQPAQEQVVQSQGSQPIDENAVRSAGRFNFNRSALQSRSMFGKQETGSQTSAQPVENNGFDEQNKSINQQQSVQPSVQPSQPEILNQAPNFNLPTVDDNLYLKENEIVKDEFDIPKINGAQNSQPAMAQQTNQAPMQQNIQQGFAQQNVQQNIQPQNVEQMNNMPSQAESFDNGEFVIPKINSADQPQQMMGEAPQVNGNSANEIVEQANRLAEENNKKIDKIKPEKQKKRKGCSVFAFILALLAGLATVLLFVLKTYNIDVEIIKVINEFVVKNLNYYIWSILGVGIVSILFIVIGLIVGKNKFKWVAFILILLILGGSVYYLYSINLLIPPVEELLKIFKK